MKNYVGQVLDNRYEMIEIIGTGGMSVVYKAKCKKLNRYVAVKILKEEFMNDTELRNRFHNESEAVAMLSHQNIVSIFDVARRPEIEYFVMELIDGITLKQYMIQRKVLSIKESLHFVTQILKALSHAHGRYIVHRDIKPQNIMVLRDGVVKVTDFGIAKLSVSSTTANQSTFGSVHYISPEQAKGQSTDERTDIYSVGIMFYEMLTGVLPYDGDTAVAVAIQHINSSPKRPSLINLAIPESLENIILKAMNKDVEKRYQTADEMLEDIEKFKQNPDIVISFETDAKDENKEMPTQKITTSYKKEENREGSDNLATKQKNNIMPLVGAGVIIVMLVIGFIALALSIINLGGGASGENLSLPSFVGMDIKEILENKDYTNNFIIIVKDEVNSSIYKKGQVISQDKKGTVKKGSTVNLSVSLGAKTTTLLDVTGMEWREARNELLKTNPTLTFTEERMLSEDTEAGLIIKTEPQWGSQVEDGQNVTLVISSGIEIKKVVMPLVVGLTKEQANSLLSDLKLNIGNIKEVASNLPAGQIVSQSVKEYTEVEQFSSIDIEVSAGTEATKTIAIKFPSNAPETFTLKISQDNKVIYEGIHYATEKSYNLTISGTGSSLVTIYINDEKIAEQVYYFN